MLLDTDQTGGQIQLSRVAGGWCFKVSDVDLDIAREIADFRDELNLFYMEEAADTAEKWWYYGQKTPGIEYESNGHVLSITVDTRMAYSNRHV